MFIELGVVDGRLCRKKQHAVISCNLCKDYI